MSFEYSGDLPDEKPKKYEPKPWDPHDYYADRRDRPESENVVPPPVPGAGNGSNGAVSVDTLSIDVFADNVGLMIDPLKKSNTLVASVDLRPGAFFHAKAIRDAVGGPEFKGATSEFVVKTIETLTDIQWAAKEMSKKYTKIEELNTLTAADLDTYFHEVKDDVSTAGGGK